MRFGHVFTGFGILFFAVAAGCGGTTVEPGGTGASGSGGTTGSGGATGSGGGGSCSALVTNAVTNAVAVRFHNDTANDLFIAVPTAASCTQGPLYTITDPSDNPVSPFSGPCDMTCTGCPCVTTSTCTMYSPVTRIAPQGVFTAEWSGALLEPRTVPASCLPSCYGTTTGAVTCSVATVPPAYPLTFSATLSPSVSCTGQACTCTPDATGTCALPLDADPVLGGNPVTATGTFAKGATSVDIVFQ